MDQEIWRPIEVTKGRYEISSHGNYRIVYSITKTGKRRELFTGHNLKPYVHNNRPYLRAKLPTYKDGKAAYKTWFLHQLVAKEFIPNPLNKPQVNHIDSNMQNNYYGNLEWVTNKENSEHAQRMGFIPIAKPHQYKNRYQISRKRVVNTETKEVFESALEVAKLLRISEKQLLKKLRGEKCNNTPFQYEGTYSKLVIPREWVPRK